ncbi:MAG: AAA family ATPase [Selenomonadaceae bacterium]|nr:AAA family ATPase [Selenomonadaceae bacterium]MBQ6130907.1 AAA family ATPase [Selenomonadaceae bacterium]MBQ7493400.1 AAA family ATPase [Selenomonadaceae bacterium]
MKDNVILTGFMGTGKTSLGKLLATKLGRPFVDIDKKIEAEQKLSIPKIFERFGEEHFRALEKSAVKELSERRGLVIATGGGTVKDEENLRLLKSSGVLICLTTEPEEIFARTARRGERPVLDGGGSERLETIKKLLAERKKFYDRADYQVDTTEWSPLQIIDDICKYLRQFRS